MILLLGTTTAKAGTNGDRVHVAGTGGRNRGLVQVRGPNTIITVEVAVRAGRFKNKKITATICIYEWSAHLLHVDFVCCNYLICLLTGSGRKRLKKCAERVGAELPVHLPSGAETQQWMRKRPWPEGKTVHFNQLWMIHVSYDLCTVHMIILRPDLF